MSFQKIVLICLVAIVIGGFSGVLEVKFKNPKQGFVSERLVSREIKNAQIADNVSASATVQEEEALRREKAAGLEEFLENTRKAKRNISR